MSDLCVLLHLALLLFHKLDHGDSTQQAVSSASDQITLAAGMSQLAGLPLLHDHLGIHGEILTKTFTREDQAATHNNQQTHTLAGRTECAVQPVECKYNSATYILEIFQTYLGVGV